MLHSSDSINSTWHDTSAWQTTHQAVVKADLTLLKGQNKLVIEWLLCKSKKWVQLHHQTCYMYRRITYNLHPFSLGLPKRKDFFVPHQTYIAHVNTCIFSFLIEPVLMNSRGKYLLISVYAITIEILNWDFDLFYRQYLKWNFERWQIVIVLQPTKK